MAMDQQPCHDKGGVLANLHMLSQACLGVVAKELAVTTSTYPLWATGAPSNSQLVVCQSKSEELLDFNSKTYAT